MKPLTPTRRSFLRVSGMTALAAAFPAIIPARAFGAADRIRLGHIGVRNQGTNNLKAFLKQPLADNVAVCDVDTAVLADAHTMASKGVDHAVKTFGDYRRLLEDRDIDAVVITVPDHWHARIMVDACEAGKDVYCEKPLSLTIAEGKAMVAAARKHNRVVQTGSQQRSDDRFRLACELVRNGRLGKLESVLVGLPSVNFDGPAVADTTPPPELDYNFWLGPAPERSYNPKHVHYLFRFYWDYSGGQMTNFGAHHLDIAQWALGRDESGPVAIDGKAEFHPDGWYEVPSKSWITYRYDDGIVVNVEQGTGAPGGCLFKGSNGTLLVTRGEIKSTPAELVAEPLSASDVRLEVSKNHHANWLEAIGSRARPIADVAIGHRSATVCHLGNIAARLGRSIQWDPKTEEIVGDSEAAAMVRRPYRAPWEHPAV